VDHLHKLLTLRELKSAIGAPMPKESLGALVRKEAALPGAHEFVRAAAAVGGFVAGGGGGGVFNTEHAGAEMFRLLASKYEQVRNCGFSLAEIMAFDAAAPFVQQR
jgi:hypothetical protein